MAFIRRHVQGAGQAVFPLNEVSPAGEVWCYDGADVQVLLRGPEGEYQPSETSKALPVVPVAELGRFLALRYTLSDTQLIRQFRDWVRTEQAGWQLKKPRGRKKQA